MRLAKLSKCESLLVFNCRNEASSAPIINALVQVTTHLSVALVQLIVVQNEVGKSDSLVDDVRFLLGNSLGGLIHPLGFVQDFLKTKNKFQTSCFSEFWERRCPTTKRILDGGDHVHCRLLAFKVEVVLDEQTTHRHAHVVVRKPDAPPPS